MSTDFLKFVEFFVTTCAELTVLFILISFVVGIINEKLPPDKIKQLLSGNRGYSVAIALGALTPFCSCSTLPMTIGLIRARAQFGPVMAFLMTSPLLNPFIIGLFVLTFGIKITFIYSAFVILLAVISGYLLQRFHFERYVKFGLLLTDGKQKHCAKPEQYEGGLTQSCSQVKFKQIDWRALFIESCKSFFSFMPYLLLGVAIGALLHGYVPKQAFDYFGDYSSLILIPAAAFIGVFLYVRASTMIPIATALIAKGMTIGTVMSLTIAGAGASLPEMIMLQRIFRWPLMLVFILVVMTTACITGFAVELI